MVANLIAVYRRRVDALAWMDAATKAEVQASCPRTTLESAIRKPGGTILVTKSKPMTLSAT